MIGNDVWIAGGAKIMSGVTIGDGSVIAANACVTKDVKPYTIVGGVPAKEIGKRFEAEEVRRLLAIKWWDSAVIICLTREPKASVHLAAGRVYC